MRPLLGCLTDVDGLAVGHYTLADAPTGCTVVLCPDGAVAGVDVRGAAPGTRETDLLAPTAAAGFVHALLLTGGSAFGLDAAGGVMHWLEARGHGFPVGPARVPIVPAAVIFDLWLRPARRPDAAAGHAACEAAAATPCAQGSVGAGAGATVGKLFGIGRAMKGGLGCASLRAGGITVAALVVVNALGDVVDAGGRLLAGARSADGSALQDSVATLLAGEPGVIPPTGSATTIGVVATDAALTKPGAGRLATVAHDGLAQRIRPVHTLHDGDTLFALATGRAGPPPSPAALHAMAAEAVARAVEAAVRAATPLPGFPALSGWPPPVAAA